ncbi:MULTISPECIES: GTP cyclohydrolase FolE2 [unclassified Pseudodesulfovibrio]|uniref:GTP cyclohydrolase FolE2 n=1 Tax=unclassified Pseudodesulfovibrio TaxID=2661612 RepID=UPI000FEBD4C8|nr:MULTISPECIES: GTP cyclohydrolase FolE2 [unclassified Pseudodesulfovibrio]MCJ2163159.1 GTP cyclohydrolase FolE2 [Pseudodesulfovibrio sp. S3-i]RWU07148.1 GTP cyclohydrolase I FolE2 [Pseudodesulfovibrio sp. S3]
MEDVQKHQAAIAMPIDRVGVKGLRLPIIVRDRESGVQHTVAQVSLSVDLPAEFKGTHMSRFVEALEHWSGDLDYASFRTLLDDVVVRLQARSAHVRFVFPYFLRRRSPVSKANGLMDYTCRVDGYLKNGRLTFTLGADVPVMTVCPCSKAISEEGAHSQRAEVRIRTRFDGFVWLEDLIEIGERSGSSQVYSLLKREDEKFVTETSFANPTFVEDVVREAAKGLSEHPKINWYKVEVESFESIHNHSAFAIIESHPD